MRVSSERSRVIVWIVIGVVASFVGTFTSIVMIVSKRASPGQQHVELLHSMWTESSRHSIGGKSRQALAGAEFINYVEGLTDLELRSLLKMCEPFAINIVTNGSDLADDYREFIIVLIPVLASEALSRNNTGLVEEVLNIPVDLCGPIAEYIVASSIKTADGDQFEGFEFMCERYFHEHSGILKQQMRHRIARALACPETDAEILSAFVLWRENRNEFKLEHTYAERAARFAVGVEDAEPRGMFVRRDR